MNILLKTFQYVWTFWTVLVFSITGVPAFIAFFIAFLFPGERGFRYGILVSRIWSVIFLIFIGMPVRVKGRRNIQRENYVIMANHHSQLDIPVAFWANPYTMKFLSKKEVEKIPVIGYALNRLHLTVDRKSPESRAESFKQMKKAVNNGHSILIFPEGTRNPGPHLTRNFYDGGFRLAIETQTPIIVLTIMNTWDRQNKHMGFRFMPGRVDVHWSEPISTAMMTEKDIPKLKEMTRQVIEENLSRKYGRELPVKR